MMLMMMTTACDKENKHDDNDDDVDDKSDASGSNPGSTVVTSVLGHARIPRLIWIRHSFVRCDIKFNQVRPRIYKKIVNEQVNGSW